ncbi:MAG: homoserine kinase [Clostridia bacterium]|nr:homoserine kinase [Clostridia bacterium]
MVRVRIPATTANLGCGFDTFGMALGYYNYIEIEKADAFSLTIRGEGAKYLRTDAGNLVTRSATAAFEIAGVPLPELAVTCENNIPLSRGMGSSSAAIVGGVYAANQLMGVPLSLEQMRDLAIAIEGHPDNVTPALFGGFTISVSEGGQAYTKQIKLPRTLQAVLAVPHFTVSTKKARAVIPKQVALEDAVYHLGHAAYLALSLIEGDLAGFGAMLTDRLAYPYRSRLIKGAQDVVAAAIAAGAIGCVISGSGPTMISFTEDDAILRSNIAAAMSEAFAENGVEADIITVGMDNQGTIVDEQGQASGSPRYALEG